MGDALPVDRGAPPSLPPPLQPAVQPGGTKHRTPVGTTRRPPLRVVPYRTGKGARELREDRIISYWLDPGVMTISLYGEDKPDSFHPPRCIRTVPRVLLQPAGYAVTDLCASPSVHLFLLLLAECGQDAEGLGAARGAQHTQRPPRQAGCQIHTEGARQGHQCGRRYAPPIPSSPPLPNAHRQTACLCTERTQYCTAQLVLATSRTKITVTISRKRLIMTRSEMITKPTHISDLLRVICPAIHTKTTISNPNVDSPM